MNKNLLFVALILFILYLYFQYNSNTNIKLEQSGGSALTESFDINEIVQTLKKFQ